MNTFGGQEIILELALPSFLLEVFYIKFTTEMITNNTLAKLSILPNNYCLHNHAYCLQINVSIILEIIKIFKQKRLSTSEDETRDF